MRKEFGIVGGLGLGAGLLYLFDPRSGKRRRSLVRDKARHFWKTSGNAVARTSRDVGNRARGAFAELQSRAREVSDDVLVDRVRAAIGHVVAHPARIQVTAEQGQVTLVGSVLKNEVAQVLDRVSSVRGVGKVLNRLSLQSDGGGRRGWLKPLLWSAGGALALVGGSHPEARRQIRRIWT